MLKRFFFKVLNDFDCHTTTDIVRNIQNNLEIQTKNLFKIVFLECINESINAFISELFQLNKNAFLTEKNMYFL